MKSRRLPCALAIIAFAAFPLTAAPSSATPPMTVTSTAMPNGSTVGPAQRLPLCGGQDRSPDLRWSGAPSTVKSYAVTLHDPDAPTPGGAWHWVAFDIAPNVTALPEGLLAHTPLARQAANAGGDPRYDGPCPPPGPPHRYVVTVYALDTVSLRLPDGVDNATARADIKAHTITTAQLIATYGL
ncbi:YbhB/YbcL family Raf kinase inhibitor-like protein [Nocardia alni]|uniref:YbhB/YbcL family Raf kinase inhibitor-like protein n=1 Tax=Nocardia alni TaxID=2815723 RepID=UPI001C249F32|nr:YbhB/YbcL family Raf kinase inhibitor-like protein [Nocardia alni]